MAKRSVIWSATANRQLHNTLAFWIERNKSASYSKKLLKRVVESTTLIAKTPLSFPESTEEGVRMYAMNHYSIAYIISPDHIHIITFWDNRQDPKKLIKILKNE